MKYLKTLTFVLLFIFIVAMAIPVSGTLASNGQVNNIANAPSPLADEINLAIDKGLEYLYQTMVSADDVSGYWGDNPNRVAITSMAILAFEIQGYSTIGGNKPEYVEVVQKGLNYLLGTLQEVTLSIQPAGDPDTNANGYGLHSVVDDQEVNMYSAGMVLMTLAASGTPEEVAHLGGEGVLGRTYREIVQDLVDYLAWAQTDAPNQGRGGWRYTPNEASADMSVTPWVVIGLEAAEENWGINVPDWVKRELSTFLAYTQDTDGGFGYDWSQSMKNVLKTGAGIICLLWTGEEPGSDRITLAQEYITLHWDDTVDPGQQNGGQNIGNFYAMYAVTKGSRLAGITTYGVHDWYQEYAEYLIAHQATDGSWSDEAWVPGNFPLSTAWALLILSKTVLAAPTPTSTPMIGLTPLPSENMTMTITADPVEAVVGDPISVEIVLSGDSSYCGQSVVVKPLDVILILDRSDSMIGNPLAQVKLAANAFVGEMNFPVDRVGVVQFNETAQLIQALTTSPSSLESVIDSITSEDGTSISEGLRIAFEALQDDRRNDANPVIVLLSDGQSEIDEAMQVANTAKAAGIRIVTVGIGDADETLMTNVASPDENGQPQYYYSPDPSGLQDIYISIARSIREYGLANDFVLRSQIDLYRFALIAESLDPVGQIAGDTIIWELDTLGGGETTFTFQVKGRQPGDSDIGVLTQAVFLECEQNSRMLQIGPAPRVSLTEAATTASCRSSCGWWLNFPWWLLLPILVLLVFAWFLWRTSVGGKLLAKRWPCKSIALILLLYIIALTALVSYTLFGKLCKTDQIYFWKITSAGDVGIYQTLVSENAANPVQSINQNSNCVACHSIGSLKNVPVLAAVSDEHNGPIVMQTLRGKEAIIPAVNGSYMAWSPDNEQIAISVEDEDIQILDLKTGELQPLLGASDPDFIETMPAWSPDGRTIAFVRAASTANETARINVPADIYTVSVSGGIAMPLIGASGDGFNYYPAYSPDGKWLAFTRHVDGEDTYADDAADLYLVPASGGQRILLRANSEWSDSWPSWSPDGQWLGFSSNRNNEQFDIYLARIGVNGQSSSVCTIAGAAQVADGEFHPVWPGSLQIPWWQQLLALWPYLIPLPILLLLAWLICRERRTSLSVRVVDGFTDEAIDKAKVTILRDDK